MIYFRISFLCLMFFASSCCQCCGDSQLFDTSGVMSEPLSELLRITNIECDGTIDGVVVATQEKWLRKRELWNIDPEWLESEREKILPLIYDLGCVDEIRPLANHYDRVILFGATAPCVRLRLNHLSRLWGSGIRFEEIVLLGSERPLDTVVESDDVLIAAEDNRRPGWKFSGELPKNEYEMMLFLLDQVNLPEGLKKVNLVKICSKMKQNNSGNLVRPITDDTVNDWLAMNTEPGSCLSISNQPYVGRQHSAICRLLPDSFEVETVGVAASERTTIGAYLDTIARWLYSQRKVLS